MSSVVDNQRESLQGPIVVNCQFAQARFDRVANQSNDTLISETVAPLFPASVDTEENSIRPGEALWTERTSKGMFHDQQPEVFSNLKGTLVPKTVLAKGRYGDTAWEDIRRHVDKKVLRFVGFAVQDIVYSPERDGKKGNYGLTSLVSGMGDILHTGQGMMRPGCLWGIRIPTSPTVRQGQRVGIPSGKIVGETYIVEPTDILPTAKSTAKMLRLTDKDVAQMKLFDVPSEIKALREDLVALDKFVRYVATVSVLLYQLQNHPVDPTSADLNRMVTRAEYFGGLLDVERDKNNIPPAMAGGAPGNLADFLVKENVAQLLGKVHLKDARVHKAISHLCVEQQPGRNANINASSNFQTCLRNGANTLLTPFAECVHDAVGSIVGRAFSECKPGQMFKANLAPGVIC